jgi:hypothetical protein
MQAAIMWDVACVGCLVVAVIPGKVQIVGLIFLCPCLFAGIRFWQTGVHIDETGVRVVGYVFSRRTAWSEIDHFEVKPASLWPFVAFMVRKDGRSSPIAGLTAPRPESNRPKVQQPVDELNELLARKKT